MSILSRVHLWVEVGNGRHLSLRVVWNFEAVIRQVVVLAFLRAVID